MQKAGLLVALIGTVGLTIYAFPGSDKRSAPLITIPAHVGDGPAPTALDKLKAATRAEPVPSRPQIAVQEPPAVLPAPRVMDAVRQELQARPAASAAAPSPITPVVAGGAASPHADAVEGQAMEKLAGRLADSPPPPATQVRPAAGPADKAATELQQATILLKGGTIAKAADQPASVPADVAKEAGAGKTTAGHHQASARVKVERRRAAQAANDDRPATSRNAARSAYAPNTFTRFDGQ